LDEGTVELENLEDQGIRPRFKDSRAAERSGVDYCPGAHVRGNLETGNLPVLSRADVEFGPCLEIWEGYALDPEIRLRGSSGGVLTALCFYCLEEGGMQQVLHTGMNPEAPWRNQTVVSRSRAELISRAGSRYNASSPCEGLGWIEKASGKSVFVGKPCDTAAVGALRRMRPELDRNLGLVLTFFCAGTPSVSGTKSLVKEMGLADETVRALHYRGDGWPGEFRATTTNGETRTMSYLDSWGKLTGFRPLRCNLCPDGLGRVADIACGDAWHRFNSPGADPGRSLILVRTERGRKVLEQARGKYLQLERTDGEAVLRAQPNLLVRRKELAGRLLALALAGARVPKFEGFQLEGAWRKLPLGTRFRVLAGTVRRILYRRWWRPMRSAA
jgi:coenzyme F420 hydrogenase subunit beta